MNGTDDRAVFIAVGSELLSPFREETNSLYFADKLASLGIRLKRKIVVGDDEEEIADVLSSSISSSNLVIVTGGLGPTRDDRTREALAKTLASPLIDDGSVVRDLESFYAGKGFEPHESAFRQALIPDGAEPLPNPVGTAPGIWWRGEDSIVILLPGVPREAKKIFEESAFDRLRPVFDKEPLKMEVVRTTGLYEAEVDRLLEEKGLYREGIDVGTLAGLSGIDLLLTSARLESGPFEEKVEKIAGAFGERVYARGRSSLEEVVASLLTEKGRTVAVAESCTGGLLAHRLTNVPGSSAFFLLGVVSYSNEAKMSLLGVTEEDLVAHGAVSDPVVRSMAEGVARRGGATYGIGISGIAGPSGGTEEKPVGTVFLALHRAEGVKVSKCHFFGDREGIKFRSAQKGLDMLRLALLSQ